MDEDDMNKKTCSNNKITMEHMLPPVVFSQLCQEDQQRTARLRQQQPPYSNKKDKYCRVVMDPYKTVCGIISDRSLQKRKEAIWKAM